MPSSSSELTLSPQGIEDGDTIATSSDAFYASLVNSQGAMEAQRKMQEDTRWAGT